MTDKEYLCLVLERVRDLINPAHLCAIIKATPEDRITPRLKLPESEFIEVEDGGDCCRFCCYEDMGCLKDCDFDGVTGFWREVL